VQISNQSQQCCPQPRGTLLHAAVDSVRMDRSNFSCACTTSQK